MKVGYFSNANLSKLSNIDTYVNSLVSRSKELDLGFLVCSGGISNDYLITKDFVSRLGSALKLENIVFRFIVGNTDFYYNRSEFTVDKERKFRSILRDYRNSEYYLPTHNIIIKGGIRIIGLESWYDYTLYRGNGVDLKDITKKSFFGIKNRDVVYITNESDYSQGIENTFDVRYSGECLDLMYSKLNYYMNSHGKATRCVVVQYFSPIKSVFGNSVYDKYMGTFKGSLKYLEPLLSNGVDECIVGCKCQNRFVKYKNLSVIGTNKDIYLEEFE